jgi:tetratricopeptide (TPR) repeat protein
MEKVFLRVYNRDIEGMIEGGQLDEAVAHCQHILKTFPMHIETYCLLGKAFLEARRYMDAADIFQRVLMSVPDDFVSHVGMSIIRDDEKRLDDAIWHMERAFEVQPSNSAIQSELRRLYGRRDGVEPPKIRLSRDALANMYSQGELFNQAIAEIRSVLADEPNRPDLQVMLMRAYFHSGQKVEAAEIAATLLKKYPYCLDSLRVLVDVLPGTARAENAQVYRQRLQLLDPYSSFTKESVFFSNQVPDSAVNLQRLDYRPGALPGLPQPDWSASLGIKLNQENHTEPPPEWLQTPKDGDKPKTSATEPANIDAAPVLNSVEDAVPDWMRAAGWSDSADQVKDSSPDNGEISPEEAIAKADIPDWLKSMAPAEINNEANAELEEAANDLSVGSDGIPEWLRPAAPLGVMKDVKIESQESTDTQMESDVTPKTPVEASGEKSQEGRMQIDTNPEIEETVPDWLKSIAPAEPGGELPMEAQKIIETKPASAENIPEWIKSMTPAVALGETLNESQEPVEPKPVPDEDIPDWLKSMVPSEVEKGMGNKPQAQVEHQIESDKEIPNMLNIKIPLETIDEASNPLNKPEEIQSTTGVETSDWHTPAPQINLSEPAGEDGNVSRPELPNEKSETTQIHPEAISAGEEAFPDWLKGMDASEVAAASSIAETVGSTESIVQTIPEQPLPMESVSQAPIESPVDENVTNKEAIPPSEEIKPLNIEDDALGWLESLATKQGAKQEELLTKPQDRSVEMPDRLRQTGEEAIGASENQNQEPVRNPPNTLPLEPLDQIINIPVATETHISEETYSSTEEVSPSTSPDNVVNQALNKSESEEAETMAWLDRLSADEKIQIGPSPNTEVGNQALPLENPQFQVEELANPVPAESTPATTESASNEDITITTWLSRLDIGETLGKNPPEQATPGTAPVLEEELPEWLKDLETASTPVETPKTTDELPEWLRQATPPEQPKSTTEPEEQAWVDENSPDSRQTVPTLPEEWVPVETKLAEDLEPETTPESVSQEKNFPATEPEPNPKIIPVSESEQAVELEPAPERLSSSVQTLIHPPTLKQTGMLSPVPVQDKDAELLSNAQTILDQDSLDESMKEYSKLVKKGRLLDEVIHDLREAIYRYPVDVIIWQTLGDAYMRANRLQDALDSYTKAEELLR